MTDSMSTMVEYTYDDEGRLTKVNKHTYRTTPSVTATESTVCETDDSAALDGVGVADSQLGVVSTALCAVAGVISALVSLSLYRAMKEM